jgi:NAD(P)-dependent dehydrogenase (short-subunit alcohol dehydrogenase family)
MARGFTESDVPRQNGKTVVITGANTGLGFETARVLSTRGARVIIACRDEQKAAEAVGRIRKIAGVVDIGSISLDLASLSSVKKCAEKLKGEGKIDLLINNAGIMIPPFSLTEDGFESQFGVNHLGPFAFTSLLLDQLNEAPAARVVNTSSLAHRSGQILFDDINADNSYKAMERYSMSKFANLLFSYELQRRLEQAGHSTISLACHPGVADTELSRYFPGIFKVLAPFARPFLNTAATGAWPTLCAATSTEAQAGDYYGPSKRMEFAGPAVKVRARSSSRDPELGARLWDWSIKLTGVDPGI